MKGALLCNTFALTIYAFVEKFHKLNTYISRYALWKGCNPRIEKLKNLYLGIFYARSLGFFGDPHSPLAEVPLA